MRTKHSHTNTFPYVIKTHLDRISITPDDIREGETAACYACPIARRVRHILEENDVRLLPSSVAVFSNVISVIINTTDYHLVLGDDVVKWVRDFDASGTATPITLQWNQSDGCYHIVSIDGDEVKNHILTN